MFQDDLDKIVHLWNNHRIRRSRFSRGPSGRPTVLYNCPQQFQTRDYLCSVTEDEINACVDECARPDSSPCDETVFELCSSFVQEDSIEIPSGAEEATVLFQNLRAKILMGLQE